VPILMVDDELDAVDRALRVRLGEPAVRRGSREP
jgi:hypothetical protein